MPRARIRTEAGPRTALLAAAALVAALLPLVGAGASAAVDDPLSVPVNRFTGRPAEGISAKVTTDAAVYPVKEGGSAAVKIGLATTASAPITEPVTVDYTTKGGTAESGKDYRRSPAG